MSDVREYFSRLNYHYWNTKILSNELTFYTAEAEIDVTDKV